MQRNHINVYAPNLSNRRERKENILNEYNNRNEFCLNIIPACEHTLGAIGLWKTIQHIFIDIVNKDEEFIILCEDDHEFTEKYTYDFLMKKIKEAQEKDADILLGGVSWFKDAIQISRDLFWVEKFSGLQFTIVFKKFYHKILQAKFLESDAADYKISSLSENKFLIYPFISTQKEFGYSDVTIKNNLERRVERIFVESSERLQLLSNVAAFYKTI